MSSFLSYLSVNAIYMFLHLAICVHVYCFLVCIYLNVCVFVTVLTGTVSVMKEQELLLMV